MEEEIHNFRRDHEKVNIITLGDTGTGKSSIILSYTKPKENIIHIKSTIGVDYKLKQQQFKQKRYTLSIYDTAGQDRYRSIIKRYYNLAEGVIFVFDIDQWYHWQQYKQIQNKRQHANKAYESRKHPLEQLKYWMQEINNNLEDVPIVVVGNKSDLLPSQPSVENFLQKVKEQVLQFQQQYKTKYYLTSALNGRNIEESFEYLLEKIYDKRKAQKIINVPVEAPHQVLVNKNADNTNIQRKRCFF